jgi:hypothetical protein
MSANHAVEPFHLNKVGYVEKEYLVSGRANVYDYARNGGLNVTFTPHSAQKHI